MAKLILLAVVVILASVLAQEQNSFNRHKNWSYTEELRLKESKWSENLTHVFIKKPVPVGFFDAWAHINPNPCNYETSCNECVSMPGSVCRYYISRSREVSFCGQRGEYLGCDGFQNLEGLSTEQQCADSGFPALHFVNAQPFVTTRTKCEHVRSCKDCIGQGCAFYITDLGYEFCGRAEDYGSYPFSSTKISDARQCKAEEIRSMPDVDGLENVETNAATAIYLGVAFVLSIPLLVFVVYRKYPQWFQQAPSEVSEGVELVEVSLAPSPSEATITTEAANDVISMIDAMP